MRLRRVIAPTLAFGTVLSLGACCHRGLPRPEPDPGAQHRALLNRQAAMLSVYEYSLRDPRVSLPAGLVPIPLAEAGALILTDSRNSEAGQSRRIRAIARVTAKAVQPAGKLDSEALRFLMASDAPIPELQAHIEKKIEELLAPQPPHLPIHPELTPELLKELRRVLLLSIPALPVWPRLTCKVVFSYHEPSRPWDSPSSCVHTDPQWNNGLVWVNRHLWVARAPSDVGKLLDPEYWDARNEDCVARFKKTCALDQNGNCVSCPNPPGVSWSGSLWEEFQLTWDPAHSTAGSSYFSNKLAIVATSSADTYNMDYCHEEDWGTRLGNYTSGKIDVDQGYSLAKAENGGSAIEVDKKIRFIGWTDADGNGIDNSVNFAASVMLTMLGDATAEQVCCTVPHDASCLGAPGPPTLLP